MLERSEASLNTEQRSFVTLRMTKPREDNHSTVMLERSEASKMVVLVITIVKEILGFSVDRWFALLRMTNSMRMTGSLEDNHSTVMLEHSEASKIVVLAMRGYCIKKL